MSLVSVVFVIGGWFAWSNLKKFIQQTVSSQVNKHVEENREKIKQSISEQVKKLAQEEGNQVYDDLKLAKNINDNNKHNI